MKFWVANRTGIWSDPLNWAYNSCGIGGAEIPNSKDMVCFEGGRVGDCILDMDVEVEKIIMSDYTGFVNLNDKNLTTNTLLIDRKYNV